jgi:hypothetical protein
VLLTLNSPNIQIFLTFLKFQINENKKNIVIEEKMNTLPKLSKSINYTIMTIVIT